MLDNAIKIVVGAFAWVPEYYKAYGSKVSPEHIPDLTYRAILTAINTAYEKTGTCTMLQLFELIRTSEYASISDVTDLTNPLNDGIGKADIVDSIKLLLMHWRKQVIVENLTQSLEVMTEQVPDVDEAEKLVANTLELITMEDIKSDKSKSLKDIVLPLMDLIEKKQERNVDVDGIPSGITTLDKLTMGWQKSDLIILAARPSMGKTALLLNCAWNANTKYGTPIYFVSAEMSTSQLAQRMLTIDSGISSSKIKGRERMDDTDAMSMQMTMEKFSESFIIEQSSSPDISDICAEAVRLKREKNIGMICIDYLQLLSHRKSPNKKNQVALMGDISKKLKGLAMELDIPVIALSQLSRAVESRSNKRPQLSDLRETGQIEQDADVVAFLYRPSYYDDDTSELQDENFDVDKLMEIIIKKHRNGELGVAYTYYDRDKQSILGYYPEINKEQKNYYLSIYNEYHEESNELTDESEWINQGSEDDNGDRPGGEWGDMHD